MTNAMAIYNMNHEDKMSAKEFLLSVTNSYLNGISDNTASHLLIKLPPERRWPCVLCKIKTLFHCFDCKKQLCEKCFAEVHPQIHAKMKNESQKVCKASTECKKTNNHLF